MTQKEEVERRGERSDKDRLQICVAVLLLISRTFNICLLPYT